MEILPECLLIYRLHDKQITSTTLERQHTEVINILQKYYKALASNMDDEMKKFYISGVYFTENPDINKFLKYAKWLKNSASKKVNKRDINYALLEILAEYKRCGVSKADVLKAMLKFNLLFLAKEIIRRKQSAKKDIKKCSIVAESLGLKKTAGTKVFPIFEK